VVVHFRVGLWKPTWLALRSLWRREVIMVGFEARATGEEGVEGSEGGAQDDANSVIWERRCLSAADGVGGLSWEQPGRRAWCFGNCGAGRTPALSAEMQLWVTRSLKATKADEIWYLVEDRIVILNRHWF
jgi:hypothetical protein